MSVTLDQETAAPKPEQVVIEPVPLNVEIEFTNVCNAACVACPRSDMPGQGFLSPETLETIISLHRDKSAIDGIPPRVTIAGGGEPLLNVHAEDMLERLVETGFETTLITNATAITKKRAERIAKIGLHSICVSFWGVERDEYKNAMQLPFDRTLEKVLILRHALAETATQISIIWVRTPEIMSSDQQVGRFWDKLGISVDLEDTKAWNRGGLLPDSSNSEEGHLPDPNRRLWCADSFFSYSYDWRGQLLLCCCNYFASSQVRLANAADGAEAVQRAKREVSLQRPLPKMCSECRLPRPARAKFLLGDAVHALSEAEVQELTDFP